MKRILLFAICFTLLNSISWAQQVLPVNNDINYEIITDTLKITKELQNFTISINNQSQETIEQFKLRFDGVKVHWTLQRAALNQENLWLIQSNDIPGQNKILAWETDQSNSQLIVYQSNFRGPYNLILDVQINLTAKPSAKGDIVDNIVLEAVTSNGMYSCNPINKSSIIIFK